MHMADEGLPPESSAQTLADPIWARKYLVFGAHCFTSLVFNMVFLPKGWELRFEHGFSPMHWSAQRGRRDLIEFIRQQVASASAPYELKAKRYKRCQSKIDQNCIIWVLL